MGRLNLSEEERRRRSELAKRLHSQGKFGGAQPGSGRPRKKRASEIVADEAARMADKMIQAFDDALDKKNPASVRVQAAKELLKIERDEAELQLKEEQALEGMTTRQLIELITNRMGKIKELGPADLIDVLDLEAEELDEDEEDDVDE